MPRLIALEWDSREARVAVATSSGTSELIVDQAFSVPLAAPGTGGRSVGEQLHAALAEHGVRRSETLVAVGRTSIELKMLSLPPAPDDELPDMVRFRAQREFNSLGPDWPIDFLPMAGKADEPRSVLAATIAPELVAQLMADCRAAGLEPSHLMLRPCASASLFLRQAEAASRDVWLLVDLLAEEADLTAIANDQVVFMRTARLSSETAAGSDGARQLGGEIRRTIAAVQHQLGGRRIEAIQLCGAGPTHAALAERLGADLGIPCLLFDPLSGVELAPKLRSAPPQNVERFAPLVGMLLDRAEQSRRTIDFLSPRRRPEPASRRRTHVLAAAAAACLVLAGGYWVWRSLAVLDGRIAELNDSIRSQKPLVEASDDTVRIAREISTWTRHDVGWLDELAELSTDLPEPRSAMLTQLRLGPHADGAIIHLDGVALEAEVVEQLEQMLRDGRHRVEGRGRNQSPDSSKYPWRFQSDLIIEVDKLANAPPRPAQPRRP